MNINSTTIFNHCSNTLNMAFANTMETINFYCPPAKITINKETSIPLKTFAKILHDKTEVIAKELKPYNFGSLGETVNLRHYHGYKNTKKEDYTHVFCIDVFKPSEKLKKLYGDNDKDRGELNIYFEKVQHCNYDTKTHEITPAYITTRSELSGPYEKDYVVTYPTDFSLNDLFKSLDKLVEPLMYYEHFKYLQITFDPFCTSNLFPRFEGSPITGFESICLNFGSGYMNREDFFIISYDFNTMEINVDKSKVVYDSVEVTDANIKKDVLTMFSENIYLKKEALKVDNPIIFKE